MNERLGLRLLGEIMKWPDERARQEFEWLRLMSRVKYDTYEDFRAGARFLERLAIWLQQFDQGHRQMAYDFIRERLIYIGPQEMQLLVERFYSEHVEPLLIKAICLKLDVPSYYVWRSAKAIDALKASRRKTLFMALSDGARIDELRRSNVGIFSNEQIVVATQLDKSRWQELFRKLRKEEGDGAQFDRIYLIDDFIASGTTLLRYEKAEGRWDGKLLRFRQTLKDAEQTMDGTIQLCSLPVHVHHYLATALAEVKLRERVNTLRKEQPAETWLDELTLSFGYTLPKHVALQKDSGDPLNDLLERYYDPALANAHSAVSGVASMMFGYAECGLPLVLEHNTPNNSVPILWAESKEDSGTNNHAMRPLFRRRQRHT